MAASTKKVCIFVDGENFRYSITALFRDRRYDFAKHDYLPEADWSAFFNYCISRPDWELVRTYWYVTREIDCWPVKVPFPWAAKKEFLTNNGIVKKLVDQGVANVDDSNDGLTAAVEELEARRKEIQTRAQGWRNVQTVIERKHDHLEFHRIGSIRYTLADRRFGKEKGVDTQMATDLITLAGIYDVALIVSGDADYIPPVSAIKNLGKLVYSVSFLTEDGKKLPGGAIRLERRVDGKIELTFDRVRELLDIKDSGAKKGIFGKKSGQRASAK